MKSTITERIKLFVKSKNISIRKFESMTSLSNGFVNNITNGIGADKMHSIVYAFPELNSEWLLTGEGEMLKDSEPSLVKNYAGKSIPLIENLVGECGLPAGFTDSAFLKDCVGIVLPNLKADFAIKAYGNSMVNPNDPNYSISNGAIVACTRCASGVIQWGDVYALSTIDGVVIKRLMPHDDDTKVWCYSFNPNNAPFELPKEFVNGIAKVVRVINMQDF